MAGLKDKFLAVAFYTTLVPGSIFSSTAIVKELTRDSATSQNLRSALEKSGKYTLENSEASVLSKELSNKTLKSLGLGLLCLSLLAYTTRKQNKSPTP